MDDQEKTVTRRRFLGMALSIGAAMCLGLYTQTGSAATDDATTNTLILTGPMELSKVPVAGDTGRMVAGYVKLSVNPPAGGTFDFVCTVKSRDNVPKALKAKMEFLDKDENVLLTKELTYDTRAEQATLDRMILRKIRFLSTPRFRVQLDEGAMRDATHFRIELHEE